MTPKIPNLVARDIDNAVMAAIQFGVSVEDFLSLVRESWKAELREKQRLDDAAFQRANR